ncbi:NAD(P)H-dependent oxidoreductase [Kiloniella laminariae]|uniref:FMN dependent NADH:quinone oxidoreductase n=1 Tax=Kiloniella laminariae TaxID=454162 RepID=A0ABT4LN53_9PROT|nr:NAD(P)H-dependent oxidoreductase [Kiloniella laminariae]MCZ4282549.1 NAD(P)H-dependent oxidoreductase [Kiloniella laminariae]
MTTILQIDASVRKTDNQVQKYNSISRSISHSFIKSWMNGSTDTKIIRRDVGMNPPAFICNEWVAAVFTAEELRTEEQKSILALSDSLIDELVQADLIVISAPMYNYGMPAALKAWFDQIIRIDKTFSFDLARGDYPLKPVLSGKKLVLITSSGEFGFCPGGIREKMNHLGPHIKTLQAYLGVEEVFEISAEYQEFSDDRHALSVDKAHKKAERLAEKLLSAAISVDS